jgi:hypothetical protein
MRTTSNRKTSYRLLFGGLAALAAGPAIAQSCMPAAEANAFHLRALQSQLMVTAITCQRDADYNAFVRKYQRDLQAAYNGVQGHFRRTSRGAAQRDLDQYITTLANAQSQDGLRAGTHFCPLNTPLFQLAMAKNDAASLAEFAVERNLVNPVSTTSCAATPASATTRTTTAARAATPARRPAR